MRHSGTDAQTARHGALGTDVMHRGVSGPLFDSGPSKSQQGSIKGCSPYLHVVQLPYIS